MSNLRSFLRKTIHAASEKRAAKQLRKEIERTTPEQWERMIKNLAPNGISEESRKEVEAWIEARNKRANL
jgi:hypothetical protein